jgi:hypothetical protein
MYAMIKRAHKNKLKEVATLLHYFTYHKGVKRSMNKDIVSTLISGKVSLPNLAGMCKSKTFKTRSRKKFPNLESYINVSFLKSASALHNGVILNVISIIFALMDNKCFPSF